MNDMEKVRQIVERKKAGIDCTEEESSEIKGFIKDNYVMVGNGHVQLIEDIQMHLPLEYNEALIEMEQFD